METKRRIVTRIFHLVLAIGVLANGGACTMVGKGTRTVIKAENEKSTEFILKRYPHLLAQPNDRSTAYYVDSEGGPGHPRRPRRIGKYGMLGLSRSPQSLRSAFESYMKAKYGASDFEAARLTVSVRDKGKTPAFFPAEALSLVAKNTAEIVTADSQLTPAERIERQNLLEAQLLNTPDLPQSTTLHHTDGQGRDIYYYYPRVEIDFSAKLLSAANLDRFSFLGLVIALKSEGAHCPEVDESEESEEAYCPEADESEESEEAYCPEADESEEPEEVDCPVAEQTTNLAKEKPPLRPRFINFEPKAADFAEFTRGQFKQNTQIQALVTSGFTQGSTVTTTSPGGETTPSTEAERARNLSLEGEGSYTYSEGVARELKDAIQRRATGLDKQGQIFFAEYRSINAIRIGGTYNFDLMLEVPACGCNIKCTLYYESDPVVKKIKADIYLVGVIRHVYERGEVGLFFRYPETENDHVYEQVVLKVYDDELIWKFNGSPWIGKYEEEEPTFTLNVVSNHEEARFVVKRGSVDKDACQTISEVIGDGSGSKTKVMLPIEEDPYHACVEFLPVVDTSAKSGTVVLKAPASPKTFSVPKDGGEETVVGAYGLPSEQEDKSEE